MGSGRRGREEVYRYFWVVGKGTREGEGEARPNAEESKGERMD